jgi:Tfp pilus assembly protein PilX
VQRGSVLLPVIAAMLVLMLAGAALVEAFGAQRMQSAYTVESVQAYWAAEAGTWHAANIQQAIGIHPTVSFAGSTYTVTKTGDEYTATAIYNGRTTRTVVAERP